MARKTAFLRGLSNVFELPKDIVLDLPTINLLGDEELRIENHKGISQLSSDEVVVKTSIAFIKVRGKGLLLSSLKQDGLTITGKIMSVEYAK